METFIVRLPVAPELRLPLPDFFYNQPDYVALNDSSSVLSFFLKPEDSEETIARIHFRYIDGIVKSHWRAPFGFLETNLTDERLLGSFWESVESELKGIGVKSIELVSWPEVYSSNSKILWKFFEERAFVKVYEDANFHLPVDTRPILAHFLKPERKRLRKCLREGLSVKIEKSGNAQQVHQKLKEFRDQKEIPLNISSRALSASFLRFPDRYIVFTVEKDKQVIALSVCLRVNEDVFYHFCLACDTQFNTLSPSVLLYASIYEYCHMEGYKYFDFGIASIRGQNQEGLYQFKKNLGGQLSVKPTFSKRLD